MVLSGAMRASRPTDEPNEPTNKIAAAVGNDSLPLRLFSIYPIIYSIFYYKKLENPRNRYQIVSFVGCSLIRPVR